MQTSQLSCPYCGSALSFGTEVAAGSVVSCLMCMRSFASESVAHATANPDAAAPTLNALMPPFTAGKAAAPPAGAPARSSNPALILGSVMLGGMALLVVGGLGVIVYALVFGSSRPAISPDANPVPLANQQIPVPDGPAPAKTNSTAKTADGVADVKSPPSTAATPADGDGDVGNVKAPPSPAAKPRTELVVKKRGEPTLVGADIPVVVLAANIPGVDQARIDAAIARGVQYLKDQQAVDGTWAGGPLIGYTALAGLTLLECKVPADDPHIVKAAHFVRNNLATLDATYELSLAILFLDRLGNPRDRVAIQGMALRLLAGQDDAGGWTYRSHQLTPQHMQQLFVFLKSHRPDLPRAIGAPGNLGKSVGTPGNLGKTVTASDTPPKSLNGKSDDPFQQLADLLNLPKAIQEPGMPPKKDEASPGPDAKPPALAKPLEGKADNPDPAKADKDVAPDKAKPKKVQPIPPNRLPRELQQLPVVGLNANKGKVILQRRGHAADNSNSQFALLGLWAARRHDVPTEYSLVLAKQRYLASQNADGGWGYHVTAGSTNTMTNVGLIGLAMGHGALPDVKGKARFADAAIQNGLRALGQHIGTPSKEPDAKPAMQNLYFLWSVERVAMLYDLKTIGGKDWYGWGAQTLLPNQYPDGHWLGAGYPGSGNHTDTCFALLFLKRSNLVPDLTENLRLYMVIRDPEAK